MGSSFSTDGSTRMGNMATGLGAVFNDRPNRMGSDLGNSHSHKRFGTEDDGF